MLNQILNRSVGFTCLRITQRSYQNNSPSGATNISEQNENHRRRDQARKARRWEPDPENTTMIFFAGQGSQYVGMAKDLLQFRKVKDMFELANETLQYNLLNMCLEGPQNILNETKYCQPAVFVTSLASLERLKHEHPAAIENCVATAGFSLGEITALTFAGALPFDKALKLVQTRAELMQKASEENPGGMATIMYGHDSELKMACRKAKEWCIERGVENPECVVANYLFPDCKVIAGSTEALKYIQTNLKTYKLRSMRKLPVSGAFHTSLMASAVEPFGEALKNIFIEEPIIKVYSNYDGKPYKNGSHILYQLPKQIVSPVKWEQTLHILYTRSQETRFPKTFTVGPGTALMTILKQVNARAWEAAIKIES